PPYYRGCWHGVSRSLFLQYTQPYTRIGVCSRIKAVYNPSGSRPARGMAGSDFRPLTNIPYCCLPQEAGPWLSTSVGDSPLRAPTHHSLGTPLPYQLANVTRAHPYPTNI